MLNLFAALHAQRNLPSPQPQQFSQKQLVHLLFNQRQCPHCAATNTVTVVPGSAAGAFDFDLTCTACATEYEVRPACQWSDQPQEITLYPGRNRVYTLQPQSTALTAVESPTLHPEFAFNG